MTKMPIARRLMSGEKLVARSSTFDPAAVSQAVSECAAHFEVQGASDLYWGGRQDHYTLNGDFGPLRLPFPTVWMEWAVPDGFMRAGKWVERQPCRIGCLLTERLLEDESGYEIGASIVSQGLEADAALVLSPLRERFKIDNDGKFASADEGVRYRFMTDDLDPLAAHRLFTFDLANLMTAGFALNLINCKNVTTEEAGETKPKKTGRNRRLREPGITYRTIKLPGSPSGGSTGEYEGIMPLHRVRGHFKTFTDDAPLLGKHTGTYWWGWQVRGKAANGEVVSDYQVCA